MSNLNENISLPTISFYEKKILEGDTQVIIDYLRVLEKLIKARDWEIVMAINSKEDS